MEFLFFGQAPADFTKVTEMHALLFRLYGKVIEFLPKIVASILVFLAFIILHRIVKKMAEATMDRLKWEPAVRQLLLSTIKFAVIAFGGITAAGQLGINVSSLVAGIGVAGLALGFASKDTIENLISGITILIDRPFGVGDFIEVDGAIGTVVEITLRSIRIRTKENFIKIIPNSKVISSQITNRTVAEQINIFLTLGISYESDIDRARKTILDTLADDDIIVREPAPAVVVSELADSSVNLTVKFTIGDPSRVYAKKCEYNEKLKMALDKAAIDIPYPCRTVYMQGAQQTAA